MEGFHFSNGKTATSIGELCAIIETSENHLFEEHVSAQRNDFANWVEHCLYDKPLADELRKTSNRIQTILLLRSAMHRVSAPVAPEPKPYVPPVQEPVRVAPPPPTEAPRASEPARSMPVSPPVQPLPPVPPTAPELPRLPPLLETPTKKRFLEQGNQREFLFGFLIGIIFGVLLMHIIRTFL